MVYSYESFLIYFKMARSFEIQSKDLIKGIIKQQERAKENNVTMVHIINLMQIKPAERQAFIDIFKAKAAMENLDFNKIKWIDLSHTTI